MVCGQSGMGKMAYGQNGIGIKSAIKKSIQLPLTI